MTKANDRNRTYFLAWCSPKGKAGTATTRAVTYDGPLSLLNRKADVQFDVYSRALIPSHFYRMKVLAWQCSVCCKIFCRSLDEVERARTDETPLYIEREFRMHNCELVLVNRQERRDARRPVRISADVWEITRFDRQRR